MSVTWQGSDPSKLIIRLKAFGEKAAKVAVEVVEETIEQGRRDVREGILNAPPTAASERRGGSHARWETGAMFYAVDKRMEVVGSRVVGSFGWLDPGSVGYKHASFQDPDIGAPYAPMMALFQAHTLATNEMKRRLAEKGFKVT